jgi:hypothetical protein
MPNINERLLNRYRIGDRAYKVHLDSFSFLQQLTEQEAKDPCGSYLYFSGLRRGNRIFTLPLILRGRGSR